MITFAQQQRNNQTTEWHEGFLRMLPAIQRHARVALRRLKCEAKDDAICEVIANCLCSYRRLYERNELRRAYASVLVRFAVALYYRGRRVGTSQCSHDVYSARARTTAQLEIRSIGTPQEQRAEWMECLTDNCRTPVPDQAHFRIEFPRWLSKQTRRNRQIADRLSLGCSTSEVAHEFKISPGRVSQIRRQFCDSWNEFNGE
jgi:hypothetical protein